MFAKIMFCAFAAEERGFLFTHFGKFKRFDIKLAFRLKSFLVCTQFFGHFKLFPQKRKTTRLALVGNIFRFPLDKSFLALTANA